MISVFAEVPYNQKHRIKEALIMKTRKREGKARKIGGRKKKKNSTSVLHDFLIDYVLYGVWLTVLLVDDIDCER